MKVLYRSIINIKKEGLPTIPYADLKKNYIAFLESTVKAEEGSYIKILNWLDAHYREYNELPSIELLDDKARAEGEEPVLVALRDIIGQRPYIGSDYKAKLKDKFDEQNKSEFQKLAMTAFEIVNSGKEIGTGKNKKLLKGIGDGLSYFYAESRRFKITSSTFKTAGDIREKIEGQEVWDAYQKTKADPLAQSGLHTNLRHIDSVCKGIKPGELVIIAAFVSQGKSTWCANIAHQGILQGKNGLYFTLEMSYIEMRDIFNILHTSAPDWLDHPKYKKLVGKMNYNDLVEGGFKDEAGNIDTIREEFFKASIYDFTTNPDYGRLFIEQPRDPLTPSSLELIMNNYNSLLAENGRKLDFVIIDYIGLMEPDKGVKSSDRRMDINRTIARLKNLALSFDNGRKIRIITPFQCNRKGFEEAAKKNGEYSLSALADFNEAEKSGDLIMALYLSKEMRDSNMIKISCLKNRRQKLFSPFECSANFGTKIITDFISTSATDPNSHLTEIPVSVG